ncbi:MAG: hypothetical protein Q9169_003704 [Polycauliona sp. 2 TL-2023]
MHFSTTHLALVVALASSVLARPQQNQYENQQATTTNNDGQYGGSQPTPTVSEAGYQMPTITPVVEGSNPYEEEEESGSVPAQCSMFKPYVAPGLLGAVCSLHMTPLPAGEKPHFPTSCFSADVTQPTLPGDDEDEDEYEIPVQPTPSEVGDGYGATVPTPTQPAGGYGNDEK